MATFVLVHGAYHGGWCWRRVADRLRRRGHDVFAPSLTGLGDRSHLLSASVGLATMVDDIVQTIESEELHDVIVVAHSFGALPTLGAIDLCADQISGVVIVDGVVAEPGHSGFSGLSDDLVSQRHAAALSHPSGLAIPPPPAEFFGITEPADIAWVNRRLRPHPIKAYTDPLPLDSTLGRGTPVTYLRCVGPVFPAITGAAPIAERYGWRMRDIDAGHDVMITAPDLLVEQLLTAQLTP